MDGMDRTHGYFLRRYYSHCDCHDSMADRGPLHGTARLFADPNHTRRSFLYRGFDERLYLFRLDWIDPICTLDTPLDCCVLDFGGDDLGISRIASAISLKTYRRITVGRMFS